jgi:hypothetical protein
LAIAGSFRVATNVARLYAARQGNWSGDGSSWGTMRVQTAPKALAVHWSEAGDRTLSFGDTTALVLVFDRQCRVVAENMPRWLEIIQEIQTRRLKVNVYALGLDSSLASAREYWAGLENRVRIVTPVSVAQAMTAFHIALTPTTLVVRSGRVVASYAGVLGPARQRHLIRRLQ